MFLFHMALLVKSIIDLAVFLCWMKTARGSDAPFLTSLESMTGQ